VTTQRRSKYKGAEEEATVKLRPLQAFNTNQKLYLKALKDSTQIIVTGYSGTGKTYMAATHAANLYLAKVIDKIVITRPNIPVGRDLGYLPGDLNEKFAPWAAPVLDVLKKQLGDGVVEIAIKRGNIEMAPLSTMRGRSFERCFVILDEAQNTTIEEMKMFLTRIGNDTTVVINGDIKQSDLQQSSGLSKILHMVKKYNLPIPVIEFGVDDIVRSDICKEWIVAFDEEGL
jgi:phosphate starvation-inducible PhoH-like protein